MAALETEATNVVRKDDVVEMTQQPRASVTQLLLSSAALQLCVVGTPMPKAIPPFAVCCAALLTDDDDNDEWSDPRVLHLVAVLKCNHIEVFDPLAHLLLEDDNDESEQQTTNKKLTGELDSLLPRSDPRRSARGSLDVSGRIPTLRTQSCLVNTSANRRALLRQYEKDLLDEEIQDMETTRSSQFVPYSSILLSGNYGLARLGGHASFLPEEQRVITLMSSYDAAYQKNVAVCGPQGFGYYARASFKDGVLFFESMIDGKREKELALKPKGNPSAVLSNPRNLEQIIAVGAQGEKCASPQLNLVGTGNDEGPPELLDTINVQLNHAEAIRKSGNGFVLTALVCHDPGNSIVFAVFEEFTAVVHDVPWIDKHWARCCKRFDYPTSSSSSRSVPPRIREATVDLDHAYRDLAATDHPLIIAGSLKDRINLVDVRNLSVLKSIKERGFSNVEMCSIRVEDWQSLVSAAAEDEKC